METKELERETFLAADVVLLIIKNEGELIDDIGYPLEFIKAYGVLQNFISLRAKRESLLLQLILIRLPKWECKSMWRGSWQEVKE